MAIPADIVKALHGAWRLARFDRGGLAFFEHDEAAFLRSFRAAVIVYPAFLLLLPLGAGDIEAGTTDWARVILVETIAYVIGWAAFPLVILPVTRFLGREELWLDFIIVYNWSVVLQYGLFLAMVGLSLSGLAPDFLQGGLLYLAYIAVFTYECYIARVVLDIAWPAAGRFVLVDLVLSELISRAAQSLH
jgi:hypothetical protein